MKCEFFGILDLDWNYSGIDSMDKVALEWLDLDCPGMAGL